MTGPDGYRGIDLLGRAPRDGHREAAPEVKWLPIADLVLDDAYQRPLGKRNWQSIERIAAQFTWGRFLPLIVCPTACGRFAIIDGQHRTHAAALRGYDAVPAMVVRLSLAEQAAAFAAVNGDVVKITMFHVYKAALAAREDWALRAEAAVADAGCRLLTQNVSAMARKPRELTCIGLVRDYVRDGLDMVVTAGLVAIARSDALGDDPEAYATTFLKPWFGALASSQRHLRLDLVRFLDTVNVMRIADELELRRKEAGDRSPLAPALRLEFQRALVAHGQRVAA